MRKFGTQSTDSVKIDSKAVTPLGSSVSGSVGHILQELEKHFHNNEDWFGLAREAGGYEIAGCTLPDFNGSYFAAGTLNSDFFYKNRDGSGFLWWDNVDSWIISSASGVAGTDYFIRADASQIGAYTNEGSATGTVTGADIADTEHVCDDITTGSLSPFQIDAGNDDWGTWVRIMGPEDTPNRPDKTKGDLHKIQVVAAETTEVETFIQIGCGASGAAALAAYAYSTVPYLTAAANFDSEAPIEFMARRFTAGDTLWARCMAIGENTMTLDFYFGLHEYDG